jgi:hypothetical protein
MVVSTTRVTVRARDGLAQPLSERVLVSTHGPQPAHEPNSKQTPTTPEVGPIAGTGRGHSEGVGGTPMREATNEELEGQALPAHRVGSCIHVEGTCGYH